MSESILDRLSPQDIAGAVRDVVSGPNWQVVLAILRVQEETSLQQILTGADAHKMAYAAGQLNALRQIPKLLEMYSTPMPSPGTARERA